MTVCGSSSWFTQVTGTPTWVFISMGVNMKSLIRIRAPAGGASAAAATDSSHSAARPAAALNLRFADVLIALHRSAPGSADGGPVQRLSPPAWRTAGLGE